MSEDIQIFSLDELEATGLDVWVDETGLHLAPPDDEQDDQ